MLEENKVWDALRQVYDPEIPVNVVDLGLVYNVQVEGESVRVDMTLTAPGCPVWPHLQQDAQNKLKELAGAKEAVVNIVWDPPWNPSMMSEDAKLELGLS
ncbi:MAG: DUF59 domain-containing protein [Chloroflexi bacterium]|nr:DUF59 domain-containing protein [Chloroflexota bacterium]